VSISDISAATEWLRQECHGLRLQEDARVISVVNKWRWTIEYTQDPNYPDFALAMIDLETMLRKTLGRPIDLRLELEADKNRRKQRNILTGAP
jgi:hypothetical protein